MITYRPAALTDAELASDLMHATYPGISHDPVMTRLRWKWGRAGYSVGRYIGERDGQPVAFLAWLHGPWEKLPERHCEIEVLQPGLLVPEPAEHLERLELVFGRIGQEQSRALGDRLALDPRPQLSELDLKEHGAQLVSEASESRRKMLAAGIALMPLGAWSDPDKLHKLHDLDSRAVQDVPHTLPIIPETYRDFERRVHAPDRPHDRYWVAVHGDRPVAMSYLKYPPVRGTVWTGFTCTDSAYRGRGIARAVKLQSLAQAVELGVPVVCTDNDAENGPMLHINEALGYRRRPGFVEHHKRVTNTRA